TPDRFIQIVASIEQTSDLDDISLDEITGKLKAFEERIKLRKGGQVESQENLLFVHGEHSGKGRRFNKRGAWADEIHRQELNAYRSTLEALHASGPLTWEKETMVTDLRFTETPVGLPYPFGNAVGMDTPPIRPRNVSLVLETFPMPFPRRFLSVSGRFLSLEQI
ncbi:zinc finger, CCHC-type containing protein, partial [Tanacetum coccineum]